MGKNTQWNNYTKEELIQMLKTTLEKDCNVKAKDFGELGLPSIKTYVRKILKLPNSSMQSLYEYFGLKQDKNCGNDGKKYHDLEEVKEIALKQGFELLNKTFNSVDETAYLICNKCGTPKEIKFSYFIYTSTRCKNCTSSPKKYTYQQIKNYIEIESNSGCELLETEETYNEKTKLQPKMALCKIKIRCHCGNEFEQSFNTFKSGGKHECNECTLSRKNYEYTYEEIKKYIEIDSNSGCQLLSTEFSGVHNNLLIRCSCGNEFLRAFSTFKGTPKRKGVHKCKLCTGATIQYTQEEMYNILKQNNVELLSEYINYNSPIRVRYSCGFEVERSYSNIIKSNFKCPHCIKSGYGRNTEQFIKEIEEITGGEYELLSEYKTMNDYVLMKHIECGHEWKVTPHNFLDSGTRCPECSKSKGETFIKNWLGYNKIKYKREYTFDDLLSDYDNPLRFDFAIFENDILKYLIEYDGEFHYLPIMGQDRLDIQQRYDCYKNEYCEDNNIPLLRIPYWEFDNIENILNKHFSEQYTKE